MILSIDDPAVQAALDAATTGGGQLFPSPEDWRGQWIYFLMIDRFHNPDQPPRHKPYNTEWTSFQGGTFQGIQAKLPYLQKLGVGALWLSPVLKNAPCEGHSYHGYGVQNFLAIEPRFASDPSRAEEELRELIDAAHALGIYVILDIILHHAGNVFAYAADGQECDELDWQDDIRPIRWRDADGTARVDWADGPQDPSPDAAVWPRELQRNDFWTRRGNSQSDAHGFHASGDFSSLKGFDADFTEGDQKPVWDILIKAHQYLIAKFDIDGFRIDTFKFLSPEFARAFSQATREFAASVGKKNFFTFGEIYDSEETISRFIGRPAGEESLPIGADAAMDYPLFYHLPNVVKALPDAVPAEIAEVFQRRAEIHQSIETAHGSPYGAAGHFVTFLDNQDQDSRFASWGRVRRPHSLTLGLACLFTLQGIPCVYYGTEQGLTGHKTKGHMDDSHVREALWGKRGGFDENAPLYQTIAALAALRCDLPALRSGGQYFRPLSADGHTFDLSRLPAGVLAYSRLLDDSEILIVANTSPEFEFTGQALVDGLLHHAGETWQVLWANQPDPAAPAPILAHAEGTLEICGENGQVTHGPALSLPVTLRPAEVQILASARA